MLIRWWPFNVWRATAVLTDKPPPQKQKVRTIRHRRLPPKGAQAAIKLIKAEREFRARVNLPSAVIAPVDANPAEVQEEEKEITPAEVPEMSETDKRTTSLSQRIRESIEAGLSASEGAEYINMPLRHYKVIANLLSLERHAADQAISKQAFDHLTEIDTDGVKRHFIAAVHFLTAHRAFFQRQQQPTITATAREPEEPAWKSLTPKERRQLKTLAARSDVDAEDKSKAKALMAAIIDGKLTVQDHERMVALTRNYYANGVRRDWKRVKPAEPGRPDISLRLKTLIERPDVSDQDKRQATELLSGIVDGYIKSTAHDAAQQLWFANKASKKELGQRVAAFDTFNNAVFMAAQACENLSNQKVPVLLPMEERIKLVNKLNASAQDLLRLQQKLTEEKKDHD